MAGTAGAVHHRQEKRWAAKEQQAYQAYDAPPPPPPAAEPDMDTKLAQLRELGELKTQGVLSEAEFEAQKRRILGS